SLRVEPLTCEPDELAPAVAWLRAGGVVAFPTDTLYGLAVDPTSAAAVHALFDLKGRDRSAPVPLVAASVHQVQAVSAGWTLMAERLSARFWPGPLSLVLDAAPNVPDDVHAGTRSIAIRVPSHRVAQGLCAAWGGALTATSA